MEIKVKLECNELAAAIFALADALEGKSKHSSAPAQTDPAQVEQAEEPKTAALTLEQVRDALSNLPSPKVKELLLELGVKKLTDLPVEKYPELLAKASAVA